MTVRFSIPRASVCASAREPLSHLAAASAISGTREQEIDDKAPEVESLFQRLYGARTLFARARYECCTASHAIYDPFIRVHRTQYLDE